jgi:hypothetical protein
LTVLKCRHAGQLARAARTDGAHGLERMSACTGGHAQRDLVRYSKRCSGVRLQLWHVGTVRRRHGDSASTSVLKPVLLPHELLSWLFRYDVNKFYRIMGTPEDAFVFWWEVRRTSPTWFAEHEFRDAIKADPYNWFPLKLFGDEIRIGKLRAMLVVHMFSAVGRERKTEYAKLPCFLNTLMDNIDSVTDAPMWQAVCWSWRCLAMNKFPSTGPNDEALTGWRKAMAGKPLLGDHHVALAGVVGDWMWTAECFHLAQNYKNGPGLPICHRCGAMNGPCPSDIAGAHSYWNHAHGAPFWSVERSHAAYLASPAALLSPASRLPGFHIQSLWPELMHGGPLGFCLTVSGSVLKEICDEAFFSPRPARGTWFEKLQCQLSAGFGQFKHWQIAQNRVCSQLKFTYRRLSLSRMNNIPSLKAKAYNSIIVCEWLVDCTRAVAQRWPDNSYFRDRASLCWALSEVFNVLRRADHWMSEQHLQELQFARDTCMRMFTKLSAMASESDLPVYPLRPKMHVFDEACRIAQVTGENPASCWTFQDEDNMRVMCDIATSCHGQTVETSSLEKWVMNFFASEDDDPANA